MNLIQLTKVNIKRILKDPLKLLFMVIMPIGVLIFVNFLEEGDSSTSSINVAYNIQDEGIHYEWIIDKASNDEWIFFKEKDKALELLETNEVAVVYNIPDNFSEKINNYEKPIIEAYKREEGNASVALELELNNNINEHIKEKLILENNLVSSKEDLYISNTDTILTRNDSVISGDMHTMIMMLVYFIVLGSSSIVTELLELKKTRYFLVP